MSLMESERTSFLDGVTYEGDVNEKVDLVELQLNPNDKTYDNESVLFDMDEFAAEIVEHFQPKDENKKEDSEYNNLNKDELINQIQNITETMDSYQSELNELTLQRDGLFSKLSRSKQTEIKKKYINIMTNEQRSNKDRINIVQYLRNGTALLKYGRRGVPHFRHFEVIGNEFLIWYSKGKSLKKTVIALNEIKTILKGQHTSVFKKAPQQKLEPCSFSILYGKENKSLDVIARNRYEYAIWVKGLEFYIEYFNDNPDANRCDIWEYNINVTKRDIKKIHKILQSQAATNPKTVVKELKKINARFVKLSDTISKMQKSKLDKGIKIKFAEIEQEMNNLRDLFQQKSTNLTSHEIWRITIEIKCLEIKVVVIHKEKTRQKEKTKQNK